jgi:hypothetical protein
VNISFRNGITYEEGYYQDWNWDDAAYQWSENVEYVMTEKGLKRAINIKEDDSDNNTDEVIKTYKNSRENIEKQKKDLEEEQKQLDEKKKKLEKAVEDSTRYRQV